MRFVFVNKFYLKCSYICKARADVECRLKIYLLSYMDTQIDKPTERITCVYNYTTLQYVVYWFQSKIFDKTKQIVSC